MTNIGNGNRIPLGARDSRDSIDYLNTPTLVRPQPQLPSSAASIVAGGHLPNGTPSTLSPLRIRVSSPNRINSDLTSVSSMHSCHLSQLYLDPESTVLKKRKFYVCWWRVMKSYDLVVIKKIVCLLVFPQGLGSGTTPSMPAHRTNGIVRIVGGAGNNTSTTRHPTSGAPTLHRPFSPSPQPKDTWCEVIL